MWILKLSGLMLIVFCGSFSGFSAANKLTARCKTIGQIILIATALKEQICFFKRELNEIYRHLINSGFDKNLVYCLANTQNKPYLKEFGFLTERDKQLLFELFNRLGESHAEGEAEHISVYINLLKNQLTEAENDKNIKARLYKSFGFWGGVVAAIFLL